MLDAMGLKTGIDLGKLLQVRSILAEALPILGTRPRRTRARLAFSGAVGFRFFDRSFQAGEEILQGFLDGLRVIAEFLKIEIDFRHDGKEFEHGERRLGKGDL